MTAPAPTARGTPAGIMLKDGYSTKITFLLNPTISFWEKTVQPAGIDGGDAIEQTTMHNTSVRTMLPRSLYTITPVVVVASYDPNVVNQILALINTNTTVTVTYLDGSTDAFFGYLQKFERAANTEGTQPECTITIVPTNVDPVAKTEATIVTTSVAGT